MGAGEALYYTQLPFSLSVKVPPVFVTGDQPTLALTLKNTTDKELTGKLIVKIPDGMRAAGTIPRTVTVPARGARALHGFLLSWKRLRRKASSRRPLKPWDGQTPLPNPSRSFRRDFP